MSSDEKLEELFVRFIIKMKEWKKLAGKNGKKIIVDRYKRFKIYDGPAYRLVNSFIAVKLFCQ